MKEGGDAKEKGSRGASPPGSPLTGGIPSTSTVSGSGRIRWRIYTVGSSDRVSCGLVYRYVISDLPPSRKVPRSSDERDPAWGR